MEFEAPESINTLRLNSGIVMKGNKGLLRIAFKSKLVPLRLVSENFHFDSHNGFLLDFRKDSGRMNFLMIDRTYHNYCRKNRCRVHNFLIVLDYVIP